MKLALFDFDGTITRDDSLIKFIRFAVGDVKAVWGGVVLSPMLLGYKLKLIPNYRAKELLISYYFKGMKEQVFKQLAREYSLEHIDSILRPKAMEKIAWHQKEGHSIAVVSASIECWLEPWCTQHGLKVLSTKLEIKDGQLTGKFLTKNCYGMEKVNRVKEQYNLEDYTLIYAYGDSSGDRELLALADEKHYRYF